MMFSNNINPHSHSPAPYLLVVHLFRVRRRRLARLAPPDEVEPALAPLGHVELTGRAREHTLAAEEHGLDG